MRRNIQYFWIRLRENVSNKLIVKYFLVIIAIVVICCSTLGFLLFTFISDRWQHEQQNLLAENAQNIALLAGRTSTLTLKYDSQGKVTNSYAFTDRVTDVLAVSGESVEADIFIVNLDGDTVLCSEDLYGVTACRHRVKTFSKSFVQNVLAEKTDYRTTSTLEGIYPEKYYVVAVPIVAADSQGNDVQIGIVCAARTANAIKSFRSEIGRVSIVLILLVSFFCIAAVYLIVYRWIIVPINNISAVAKAYGKGDFSARVPVKSNDEIGQLSNTFNNMATSLASSETMHRSFIANVSHELKTPMTTISGFIHGILDGVIPPEEHQKYLTTVANESDRLARLVRAMLDLSKIDSGAMKLNKMRFDMTESIFRTVISFDRRIEEKNLEIRGGDEMASLFVDGDPDLIHQVIYNLFENAVKFANENGYVELQLTEKGKDIYFRIRNSGAGLSDEELHHIFERFYKTDRSRSLDKTGVGLGLYIVRTIINLHGGEIKVSSQLGEYTEFEFYFPRYDKSAE